MNERPTATVAVLVNRRGDEAQGRWLRSRGYVRAEALKVIQSCVDLSEFRSTPNHDKPVEVLGAIGRLDAQKGFDTLIAALRKSDAQIELHIYGEGAEKTALQALAQGDSRIKSWASQPILLRQWPP